MKEFEEKVLKEDLYVGRIENTQKYGRVSASRNRIIDICPTQFLTFLDGDEPIYPNILLKYQKECKIF